MTFSGGTEMEHWTKMSYDTNLRGTLNSTLNKTQTITQLEVQKRS